MDLRKIGSFLKELRKEKGMTQEQLAERFGVSGRSVSRWETGSNMPDLSILVELAEYYGVDIKEILNGERKGRAMDKELKETLQKVADYSELEKKNALKAGNTAFLLMFGICTAAIVLQMLLTADLKAVLGETAALVLGGVVYMGIMVHHGIWETGSGIKSTPAHDAVISILCAAGFSVIYAGSLLQKGAGNVQAMKIAGSFFVGIAVIGFCVLRFLAYSSSQRKREAREEAQELVKLCTVQDNLQAEMLLEALREQNIPAVKEDLGNAGLLNLYGGNSRAGERIYIEKRNENKAQEILKGLGLL